MEPVNGGWEFKCKALRIIHHPNAKSMVQRAAKNSGGAKRFPAAVGTYNNFQGKTARDELAVPMGEPQA